jgi:hypothetical protein
MGGDTIAISRGTDGDCGQLFFSSKSPHPPLSHPAFPSQPNPVSASITHPDTLLPSSSVQLWAIPPSPLLSAAVAPTSTDQNDASPATCPPLSTSTYDLLSTVASSTSSSSVEANDGPPATHLPPSAPSHLSPPTVPTPSDPAEYFSNEVGPDKPKRIGYLVEATQDFIQSASPERRIFTAVLGLWSCIFGRSGPEPILRLKNLSQGYATIQHYFPFADLLYIIYFGHEVGQLTESLPRKVGKGSGQGRQTIAFSKTAKALGWQEKDVKAVFRKSRNYMLLLQHGGPGFLLQIGPGVAAL